MNQDRAYRNQRPQEQQTVFEHQHHVTRDTTRHDDARQVIYCTECKVYFEAGEHPNIHAKQLVGALA